MPKYKRIIYMILVGGMIITPLVLVFLPSDFFDHGQAICPSVIFFDTECFGCGTTRATMRLIHLDFKGAWQFNKLSFIVVPYLIYLYQGILRKFILRARGIEKVKKDKDAFKDTPKDTSVAG